MIGFEKAYKNVKTNHSVRSSLREKKELSRRPRVNNMLVHFTLMSSALDKKAETTQMLKRKRKVNIAMEVLHEVSVTYPEKKEYIDENLERQGKVR